MGFEVDYDGSSKVEGDVFNPSLLMLVKNSIRLNGDTPTHHGHKF